MPKSSRKPHGKKNKQDCKEGQYPMRNGVSFGGTDYTDVQWAELRTLLSTLHKLKLKPSDPKYEELTESLRSHPAVLECLNDPGEETSPVQCVDVEVQDNIECVAASEQLIDLMTDLTELEEQPGEVMQGLYDDWDELKPARKRKLIADTVAELKAEIALVEKKGGDKEYGAKLEQHDEISKAQEDLKAAYKEQDVPESYQLTIVQASLPDMYMELYCLYNVFKKRAKGNKGDVGSLLQECRAGEMEKAKDLNAQPALRKKHKLFANTFNEKVEALMEKYDEPDADTIDVKSWRNTNYYNHDPAKDLAPQLKAPIGFAKRALNKIRRARDHTLLSDSDWDRQIEDDDPSFQKGYIDKVVEMHEGNLALYEGLLSGQPAKRKQKHNDEFIAAWEQHYTLALEAITLYTIDADTEYFASEASATAMQAGPDLAGEFEIGDDDATLVRTSDKKEMSLKEVYTLMAIIWQTPDQNEAPVYLNDQIIVPYVDYDGAVRFDPENGTQAAKANLLSLWDFIEDKNVNLDDHLIALYQQVASANKSEKPEIESLIGELSDDAYDAACAKFRYAGVDVAYAHKEVLSELKASKGKKETKLDTISQLMSMSVAKFRSIYEDPEAYDGAGSDPKGDGHEAFNPASESSSDSSSDSFDSLSDESSDESSNAAVGNRRFLGPGFRRRKLKRPAYLDDSDDEDDTYVQYTAEAEKLHRDTGVNIGEIKTVLMAEYAREATQKKEQVRLLANRKELKQALQDRGCQNNNGKKLFDLHKRLATAMEDDGASCNKASEVSATPSKIKVEPQPVAPPQQRRMTKERCNKLAKTQKGKGAYWNPRLVNPHDNLPGACVKRRKTPKEVRAKYMQRAEREYTSDPNKTLAEAKLEHEDKFAQELRQRDLETGKPGAVHRGLATTKELKEALKTNGCPTTGSAGELRERLRSCIKR